MMLRFWSDTSPQRKQGTGNALPHRHQVKDSHSTSLEETQITGTLITTDNHQSGELAKISED
jgi:hypothetical protein